VENECTSHIFGLFPIFLPKIIEIGGNLTKFWQKQICLVFLRHGVQYLQNRFSTQLYRDKNFSCIFLITQLGSFIDGRSPVFKIRHSGYDLMTFAFLEVLRDKFYIKVGNV